jgi:hypothetical protein
VIEGDCAVVDSFDFERLPSFDEAVAFKRPTDVAKHRQRRVDAGDERKWGTAHENLRLDNQITNAEAVQVFGKLPTVRARIGVARSMCAAHDADNVLEILVAVVAAPQPVKVELHHVVGQAPLIKKGHRSTKPVRSPPCKAGTGMWYTAARLAHI